MVDLFYLIICYSAMFGCCLLETCPLLMKYRRSGPRGEGGREAQGAGEGEETIIRIYCMRKESMFNKREK